MERRKKRNTQQQCIARVQKNNKYAGSVAENKKSTVGFYQHMRNIKIVSGKTHKRCVHRPIYMLLSVKAERGGDVFLLIRFRC